MKHLVSILCILGVVGIYYLAANNSNVQASSIQGCDLVNSTGYIEIYYCVDPYSDLEYYINSVGFMMPKPE